MTQCSLTMRDFMAVPRVRFNNVKLIIVPSCIKMVKRGASPFFFSQFLSGEFVDIIAHVGFSRVLAACKGPGFVYTSTNPTHLLSLSLLVVSAGNDVMGTVSMAIPSDMLYLCASNNNCVPAVGMDGHTLF